VKSTQYLPVANVIRLYPNIFVDGIDRCLHSPAEMQYQQGFQQCCRKLFSRG